MMLHACADAAKCQLAASGVAAAWRLGQWDVLSEHLPRTHVGYERLDAEDRWEVLMPQKSAIHAYVACLVRYGCHDPSLM